MTSTGPVPKLATAMNRQVAHSFSQLAAAAVVPANSTTVTTLSSPLFQLSDQILRLLRCGAAVTPTDSSAQLQIVAASLFFDYVDMSGAVLDSAALPVAVPISATLPATTSGHVRLVAVRAPGDLYTTLGLDTGINPPGIVAQVQTRVEVAIKNNDGAASHNFLMNVVSLYELFPRHREFN